MVAVVGTDVVDVDVVNVVAVVVAAVVVVCGVVGDVVTVLVTVRWWVLTWLRLCAQQFF